MSGKPWTPERKAAQAIRMRARCRNPKWRAAQSKKSRAAMADPVKRAQASERMKLLNERMRTDAALKKKCVKGQKRARRKPSYRAVQSLTMKETMAKPENRETARQHACAINRDPAVRERQSAGRRRKLLQASAPPAPEAPPRPLVFGDVDTIFLQLLAAEAGKGALA